MTTKVVGNEKRSRITTTRPQVCREEPTNGSLLNREIREPREGKPG